LSNMAYPANFLRLVVIGNLYGTEMFTFGLSLAGSGTPVAPTEVPQGVWNALDAYFSTAGLVSSKCLVTSVKLNEIGVNGRYVNQTTVEDVPPFNIQGSSGTSPAPQVALAVSLTTPVKRGRAHAGRFYSPVPGFVVGTGGLIAGADCLAAANAGANLIKGINASLTGWRVSVVSDVGAGAIQPVTGVRVGHVLDTIRSRRNALVENHIVNTTPIP